MARIIRKNAAFCILTVLLFCGCGKNSVPQKQVIRTFEELNSPQYRIGCMTGIVATDTAKRMMAKAQYAEFPMPVDAFTALCSGKVDAVVLDRPTLEFLALAHPELSVLKEDLAVGHISVAAARRSAALMAQVNEFIRQYRADGSCRQMFDRWFHTKDSRMPQIPEPEKPTGTLKVGITVNNEPMCFLQNGKIAGFDSEFALRLGAFLNRKVQFTDIPYDALTAALKSGRIDLAIAQMDAQPEREESVLFSDNYIDSPVTAVVRCREIADLQCSREQICRSFVKTFVHESRWKLILQGLGTTIVITFFAVLAGTVLALVLCLMCRSKSRIAVWTGERFISLMMGTPVLVVLMIFYYVVFARVDIHGIFVAILVFSLDFAAYTGVTLRSGIDMIPHSQMEAALALGHRPTAAFFRFILPQAVYRILPVYRGTVISTLKSTSIVGYIAIMDLTKAGDIIRSRTYEAFFPLIAIALLYFLSAKCLTGILLYLEKRMDPEQHRKKLSQQVSHD